MILVDPRVGSKHLLDPLNLKVNCTVKGSRLHSADVCFEGNGPDGPIAIGIELKKLRDMLGSMRSERLAGDQVVKMAHDYEMCFIIIEGIWKPNSWNDDLMTMMGRVMRPLNLSAGTGTRKPITFKYGELFKHIISLSVLKNVIVLWSSGPVETVAQIAHLYAWWQRDWEAHRSTDPIKLQTEVTFTNVSLLRKMAAELPGIGWVRSKEVEKAFISVFHMVNASQEEWQKIPGIGRGTANKAWKVLREMHK